MIRIVQGLILIVVGALITIYSEKIFNAFGYLPFAEKWFGGGGTRLFYKLLGILVAFFGGLVMTNLTGPFLRWSIGWMFGF